MLGVDFRVVPSGAEEGNPGTCKDAAGQVECWAREKAMVVAKVHPDHWVLAADTEVVLRRRVFSKPSGPREAKQMLRDLSGRSHRVITGVCLLHEGRGIQRVRSVTTRVLFRPLSDLEVDAYVKTGEPLDKAGAYGIQGMGASLVRSVTGSYTNVVGLPLSETLEWLLQLEIVVPVGRVDAMETVGGP